MKLKSVFTFLPVLILLAGCGKSDLEIEKEKIRQQALELQQKIDSAQNIIDSERVSLDSLKYRIKSDSVEIDSMMKKINKLK